MYCDITVIFNSSLNLQGLNVDNKRLPKYNDLLSHVCGCGPHQHTLCEAITVTMTGQS